MADPFAPVVRNNEAAAFQRRAAADFIQAAVFKWSREKIYHVIFVIADEEGAFRPVVDQRANADREPVRSASTVDIIAEVADQRRLRPSERDIGRNRRFYLVQPIQAAMIITNRLHCRAAFGLGARQVG